MPEISYNLQEIINRPNEVAIEEGEAYFVLKEYVRIRKGVDIEPKIDFNLGFSEVEIMQKMLNCAIAWLKEHQ